MPDSIESVVKLEADDSGRVTPMVTYKKKSEKKAKGTIGVRQAEQVVRRVIEAQQAFVDAYLDQHNKSARKKRDGWVADAPANVFKATAKGLKKLVG